MSLAADEGERRLVAEMVLDVAHGHARAVQLGGERVRDAGHVDVLGGHAGALGGGRRGDGRAPRQPLGQEATALREALRVRGHAGHVLQLRVGVQHEAVVDVEHVLAQDGGLALEREVVERGRDRPLERVLLRHHAELAFAAVHGVEHLVERRAFEKRGLVDAQPRGEGAGGLVGIGAGGAEVGEHGCGDGHGVVLRSMWMQRSLCAPSYDILPCGVARGVGPLPVQESNISPVFR